MKEWLKQLLSKILGNGFLFLLIIAVLYILFLRECKKPVPCPAKDEIIIKSQTWDSILALADKPAIVHIDTVYIKGKTVYVYLDKPIVPVVDSKDTTINIYADTLLKEDIDVSYTFKVRGVLLNRKWEYRPITTLINRVDTIYVPKIIKVEKLVPVSQNGLYAYGMTGGNASSFLFGGGLDFITKKNTEIGYLYQRFGNSNIHSVKLGVKIFNKK